MSVASAFDRLYELVSARNDVVVDANLADDFFRMKPESKEEAALVWLAGVLVWDGKLRARSGMVKCGT